MGGQRGSAPWDAASFFFLLLLQWLMFHSVMTRESVYVRTLASVLCVKMGHVCFDVAKESGDVKYACKVRTELSF